MNPHVHEHHADPSHLVDALVRVSTARGLRLTFLRRRVFELIAAAGKPIKAYDLLERLRGDRARAAPPTVYRALDFLLANGFIHKLESINAFTSCHHPEERHTVPFLICDTCSEATELCDGHVARMLDEEARRVGFLPGPQTLEMHGTCRRCQEVNLAQP